MSKPNVIASEIEARRLILFEGIYRGQGKRPSDIDGVIDYNSNLFIFFEVKKNGTMPNDGQRYLLEALCDRINKGGGLAYALICWHNEPENVINDDGTVIYYDVKLKDTIVIDIYLPKGIWDQPKSEVTCLKVIEWIEKKAKDKGINLNKFVPTANSR